MSHRFNERRLLQKKVARTSYLPVGLIEKLLSARLAMCFQLRPRIFQPSRCLPANPPEYRLEYPTLLDEAYE
jgi:hypothetical protein